MPWYAISGYLTWCFLVSLGRLKHEHEHYTLSLYATVLLLAWHITGKWVCIWKFTKNELLIMNQALLLWDMNVDWEKLLMRQIHRSAITAMLPACIINPFIWSYQPLLSVLFLVDLSPASCTNCCALEHLWASAPKRFVTLSSVPLQQVWVPSVGSH